MRETKAWIVAGASIGAAVAALLPLPHPARAGGGSGTPFLTTAMGPVQDIDATGFTVDRVRVELPTASTLLPWQPRGWVDDVDRSLIRPGYELTIAGSLQEDGTVLARQVEPMSDDERNCHGLELRFVAGTIQAIDADSITVADVSYRIVVTAERSPSVRFSEDRDRAPTLEDLRVGDALFFYEYDDDELGVPAIDRIVVHPSGDGATLSGRITRNLHDGPEDQDGDYGTLLGHDGVFFEVAGVRAFTPLNPDLALRALDREPDTGYVSLHSALYEELHVGDAIVLTGRLRDGVFFVEDWDRPRGAAARRSARVDARGIVTATDSRGFEVNGMPVVSAARGVAKRRSAPPAVGVGDVIRVRGRLGRDGTIRPQRIRHGR